MEITVSNVGTAVIEKCPTNKKPATAKAVKGLYIVPPNIDFTFTSDWTAYVNEFLSESFPGWKVKGWKA